MVNQSVRVPSPADSEMPANTHSGHNTIKRMPFKLQVVRDYIRRWIANDQGIAGPLKVAAFRRVWIAAFMSDVGTLVQGVAIAWAMTEMTTSADKVGLVQTALGVPAVLMSVPAGAFADLYDRRAIALVSLIVAAAGAVLLTVLAALNLLTPDRLLVLCLVIGGSTAILGPAWQSFLGDQVPPKVLPAAVALDGMSYNMARSVGPAIGGAVVAVFGAMAAFSLNSLLYVPLIAALVALKREKESHSIPRESLARAMIVGIHYLRHSPSIQTVLLRSLVTGILCSTLIALMPLIARDLLKSGAGTFGLMLSSFGIGAVIGAINLPQVRARLSSEEAVRACALAMSASTAMVAISETPAVTALALGVAGAAWTMTWSVLQISIQLSVPRWVVGRSLAAYGACATGGVAMGGWAWGALSDQVGISHALLTSAALLFVSPIIGSWKTLPGVRDQVERTRPLRDPDVKMTIDGHQGPVIVEIEYRVGLGDVGRFGVLMKQVGEIRRRNGAFGWSIAQDISEPELWTERYHCPTWHDYLRHRNRFTESERATERQAYESHRGPEDLRVRRMLER